MSSASSTERGRAGRDTGFQPWHFYMLLSLAGATWAVIISPETHPAALLLLSAAVVAAGAVGVALHHAITGFFARSNDTEAPSDRTREFLFQEKALVLRSIKELEFDRAMGKVSDKDFADLDRRLRARAMEVMEQLEGAGRSSVHGSGPSEDRALSTADRGPRTEDLEPPAPRPQSCPSCGEDVGDDARFCRHCGVKL